MKYLSPAFALVLLLLLMAAFVGFILARAVGAA